ncbi:MAG TPA: DUF1501 domain-containing protein [Candidatus Kryptonia bacterium]|nr:DUF1501 domain-containing protein [Candidatus Kryptonia bacterium]
MQFTRRQFLKASAAASAASAFPSIWWRTRQAQALTPCESGVNLVIVQLEGGNDGINTVIPMTDGTGGSRTVYEAMRPAIGIDVGNPSLSNLTPTQVGNDPLHNGELALHPHMLGLKSLYDSGNLAVLLGVHYPNPNLSHFESEDIWYHADPARTGVASGWMGRTLDQLCSGQPSAVPAVDTDSQLTPLFYGGTSVMAFDSLSDLVFPVSDDFDATDAANYRNVFDQIYAAAGGSAAAFVQLIGDTGAAAAGKIDAYATANESTAKNLNDLIHGTANGSGGFGGNGRDNFSLATSLRTVFALMKGQQPGNLALGCRVFRVAIGGFDTHSQQGIHAPLSTTSLAQKVATGFPGEYHGHLLYHLDRAISAFWRDCVDDGNLYKNTVIMTFSEFGRRIEENGSGTGDYTAGTDHGSSAPMFVVGPKAGQSAGPSHLVGDMYGAYSELDHPDSDGNPVLQLDFRHMYGELISKWFGLSPAATNTIIGNGFTYAPPGFLV